MVSFVSEPFDDPARSCSPVFSKTPNYTTRGRDKFDKIPHVAQLLHEYPGCMTVITSQKGSSRRNMLCFSMPTLL
jgi:hypothetical protein